MDKVATDTVGEKPGAERALQPDLRELAKGHGLADRKSSIRDVVFQMLHTAIHDAEGAIASLHNDDDVGLEYHLKRMLEGFRLIHSQMKELRRA